MNLITHFLTVSKEHIMQKNQIVRTPQFAGGGITPKEKLKMDDCAKFWIANAMSTHQKAGGALKIKA